MIHHFINLLEKNGMVEFMMEFMLHYMTLYLTHTYLHRLHPAGVPGEPSNFSAGSGGTNQGYHTGSVH